LVPDAPIEFANVPEITDSDKIGVVWQDGLNDGSTPVLDYRIWYALEANEFEILEAGVLP
jgi:hypothetical protein